MDSTLITILTGSGVCGVFCILFIFGVIVPKFVVEDQKAEIAELKAALEAERERASASVAAASATRDVLAAIQIGRSIAPVAGHDP